MLGAAPYITGEFGCTPKNAKLLLTEWMTLQ